MITKITGHGISIHAGAHATRAHISHVSHSSSGLSSRIFGWILHAAIWHLVGDLFRKFPILVTIGFVLMAGFLAFIAVRFVRGWLSRRHTESTAR